MKRLLLLLLPLLTVMQACTKEISGGQEETIISSSVTLLVSDEQRNDLLDPTSISSKSVDLSKVKVFYVKDGKEELFDRKDYDSPRGFRLNKPEWTETRYSMLVYTNCESGEDISTTILEWDDGHRDIIKTAYLRPGNGSIIQQKIWINDELIWDAVNKIDPERPVYEITR